MNANHHYQIYEGFGALPANDNWQKKAEQPGAWTGLLPPVFVAKHRADAPTTLTPAGYTQDAAGNLRPLLPTGYRSKHAWLAGPTSTPYYAQIFAVPLAELPEPTTDRKGRYIRTASGRRFFPHDPRPEDIFPEDIAYSLARLQRYGGHASKVYSVAEHCVLGADHILAAGDSSMEALDFLLHDAAEGLGFVDLPAPTKSQLPEYAAAEHKCWRAVSRRFGLETEMLRTTKAVDKLISSDEMRQVMHGLEPGMPSGLGITLKHWGPTDAQWNWLDRFERLYKAVHGEGWRG